MFIPGIHTHTYQCHIVTVTLQFDSLLY